MATKSSSTAARNGHHPQTAHGSDPQTAHGANHETRAAVDDEEDSSSDTDLTPNGMPGFGQDGAAPAGNAAPSAPAALVMAEPFDPWRHDLTELGNARRLYDAFGKDLHWVLTWNKWIVFRDARWRWDAGGVIVGQAARQLVDAMAARSRAEETGDGVPPETDLIVRELAALLGKRVPAPSDRRRAWAKTSQSRRALENMVVLLRGEAGVTVAPTALDADPWLLGVQNGVVDLRTGRLRPAGRAELIMKTAGVPYHPDAPAPRWERFLEEVLPEPQSRAFLQRALGYSLTGDTREQVFFLLHGSGANGKSLLLDAFQAVLGDYGQEVFIDTLLQTAHGGIPNDLARLSGARFAAARETDVGQPLDEARVKRLTGGDRLTARFLNREFFDFTPTHKLWLVTNNLPPVRETGHAFWRRVIVIPFLRRFEGDKIDRRLLETLQEEAPGILAWAVRGSLAWQRDGLNAPPAVAGAGHAYRAAQDAVGLFLADCCEAG